MTMAGPVLPPPGPMLDHVLDDVKARLGTIVERAKALFEKARADDFPDVGREADALKQRIASVRRRLTESKT